MLTTIKSIAKIALSKLNGIVLYNGPSLLTGEPIIVVATRKSSNGKTGNMVQTFILRADTNPVEAIKNKLDDAICGACPHRQSLGGGCYVNVGQGPNAVYKAAARGSYPQVDLEDNASLEHFFKGRKVRLGAYGDPAAVPVAVWDAVTRFADGHTGYTHQSAHKAFDPAILNYCMVSADTPKAAMRAHAAGHATFRVKTPEAPALPNEIECLSDSHGISCLECGLCKGKDAQNVYINVHGTLAGRYTAKFSKANLIAVA